MLVYQFRHFPGPESKKREAACGTPSQWPTRLAIAAFPLPISRFSLPKLGEPRRTRTCNPLIKSQLLYQLS